MRIDTSGRLLIGESSAVLDTSNALLQMGAAAGANLVLYRDDSTVAADDSLGLIRFYSNAGSNKIEHARISGLADGTSGGVNGAPGRLVFYTEETGSDSDPVERMRIDRLGDVFIGTTSNTGGNRLYVVDSRTDSFVNPSDAILRVQNSDTSGTTTQTSLAFTSSTSSSGADSAIVSQAEDGSGNSSLQFWTDTNNGMSEKLRIDSSGDVGVGTTSNYADSVLEVRRTAAGDGVAIRVTNDTTTDDSQSGIIFTTTTSDFTSAAIAHKRNDNALIFYNGQSDGGGGFANATERMRIDTNGRLGLGTTSPARDFHNGSGVCLTTGAAPQYRLNGGSGDSNDNDRAIFGLATSNNHFFSGTVAGDTILRTTSGGNLLLGTGTEERFRIASNGRVTAQVIYGTPLSGTTRDVFIEDGGQLGYINSIREAKVNINLLSNVDWLYQLQPSSFNYKLTDQEGAYTGEVNPELEYGLIAEDVEPVAPELCFYDEVDGEQVLRGVHYKKLIVPMLKALQEANAKIETLEASNTDLLARVTALES